VLLFFDVINTNVVEKSNSTKKGKKTPLKTAAVKKVSPKISTKEKQVAVRTLKEKTGTTKTKGVAAKSGPKKKLSPRNKLIQEIKKKLIMQRNELLNEAKEALTILPGQATFPDMADQASAEIDRGFMLSLREREQRLLRKIEQAIEKIENGSFGICEVCGEEIELKRLNARPVTTMCISCKTEQEEDEKLRVE
jgi:DnaK suppressor protein